jgi:hypothetical protein
MGPWQKTTRDALYTAKYDDPQSANRRPVMRLTASSSAAIIPLKPVGHAGASKAWLDPLLSERRLTHGEKTMASRLFLYIDRKHFEATGQLMAYPGWARLQDETNLTERSVARGMAKLEHIGVVKIIHGGFDPKTGQRRPNKYILLLPSHLTQESGGFHLTKSASTCQNHLTKPPDSGVRITVESTSEINKGDSNLNFKEGRPERGLPRGEWKPESNEEKRRRWRAEGKSEFTGQPLWKRW